MIEKIIKIIKKRGQLAQQAYKQYEPLVNNFINLQSKDVNHICHTMDFMLDFCFDTIGTHPPINGQLQTHIAHPDFIKIKAPPAIPAGKRANATTKACLPTRQALSKSAILPIHNKLLYLQF